MLFYFFGLISALCFGISNVYWKSAGKSNSFPSLVFFRGIIASTIFGMVWFEGSRHGNISSNLINFSGTYTQYVKTITICLVCSFGLVFYLLSLQYSPVSISVPISSINWFSILTAVFVLGETFKPIYYFSFSLSIIGILCIKYKKIDSEKRNWNQGVIYSILASIFWGVTYSLFKISASWIGAIPLAFLLESSVTIIAFFWIQFNAIENHKKWDRFSFMNIKHYCILSGLLIGGTLFFNLSIQRIPILVINILGNFTLITSILVGILFIKEKLSVKQIIGILLLLLSIIILQYPG